ncbi:hypothetical protein PR048_030762 [Dryococelus australis]|uniref:Uncharacterized protein n=1 Tax=Dryococelus australis TaxID=614101 RepID=A0ABQ9GAK6_9NEOP|nr:hypothetical protein PR048_030762 [Dryococelus australis]
MGESALRRHVKSKKHDAKLQKLPSVTRMLLQDHVLKEHNKTLLNIDSCGLHAVHSAFKTGCSATYWLGYS